LPYSATTDTFLGGLRRDAAVLFVGLQRKHELVADCRVALDEARVCVDDMLLRIEAGERFDGISVRIERRFLLGIFCFRIYKAHGSVVDNEFYLLEVCGAGRQVHFGPHNLAALAELALVRGCESRLDGLDDLLARNAALFFHLSQNRIDYF
jgi:hypothetical protein